MQSWYWATSYDDGTAWNQHWIKSRVWWESNGCKLFVWLFYSKCGILLKYSPEPLIFRITICENPVFISSNGIFIQAIFLLELFTAVIINLSLCLWTSLFFVSLLMDGSGDRFLIYMGNKSKVVKFNFLSFLNNLAPDSSYTTAISIWCIKRGINPSFYWEIFRLSSVFN